MALPTLNSITLNLLKFLPSRKKKTARITVPEKEGTVKQHLGFESRRWQLTGVFTGASRITNRDSLQGSYDNNTTVTLVDDESNSFSVKILDFKPVTPNFGNTRINFTMLLEEQ